MSNGDRTGLPERRRFAGTQPKLNAALIDAIVDLVRAGLRYKVACRALGIQERSIADWKYRADKARRGVYRELRDRIRQAESELKADGLAAWTSALGSRLVREDFYPPREGEEQGAIKSRSIVPPDWRAAQALLQSRFPGEFRSYRASVPPEMDDESDRDRGPAFVVEGETDVREILDAEFEDVSE